MNTARAIAKRIPFNDRKATDPPCDAARLAKPKPTSTNKPEHRRRSIDRGDARMRRRRAGDAWTRQRQSAGDRRFCEGPDPTGPMHGLRAVPTRAQETRPESEVVAMNPRRSESDAGSAYARTTEAANAGDTPRVSGEHARVGGRSLDALPVLVTMGEVAALLRTSRKAVYAMAERGQLAGLTRIGRRLLVRRDDLVLWLDERRAASPGGSRR
jgi:excisionase family DNA binding protein